MNVLVARRLRCAACDSTVDISTALSWRCPHAVNGDRHHVLRIESDAVDELFTPDISDNPFVMFRKLLAWDSFAASHGASDAERREFIEIVDAQVASVAEVGFRVTPFARHSALSDALQFSSRGGVWVKDETHGVGGSHKARHLFTELLHLLFAESRGLAPWGAQRPELAIASCGNAAIAASTLAAAAGWPIRVFVPESSDAHVLSTLHTLNAIVEVCPRLATDPAGDPCVLRFRERVAMGAIPFGVQGPENAWCLDGGRVIGWEMLHQLGAFNDSTGDDALHRVWIWNPSAPFAWLHEFKGEHQPESANVTDPAPSYRDLLHASEHLRTARRRVLNELLALNDVKCGERCGARDHVATVRSAMRPWRPALKELFARDDPREGETRRDPLGHH